MQCKVQFKRISGTILLFFSFSYFFFHPDLLYHLPIFYDSLGTCAQNVGMSGLRTATFAYDRHTKCAINKKKQQYPNYNFYYNIICVRNCGCIHYPLFHYICMYVVMQYLYVGTVVRYSVWQPTVHQVFIKFINKNRR